MTSVYPQVNMEETKDEWREFYPLMVDHIDKDVLETRIFDDPDVSEAISNVIDRYLRHLGGDPE